MRCGWTAATAITSGGSGIQSLRPGECAEERQTLRETLFDFRLKGIVVRRGHTLDQVVIGGEGRVFLRQERYRLNQLGAVKRRQSLVLVRQMRQMRGS